MEGRLFIVSSRLLKNPVYLLVIKVKHLSVQIKIIVVFLFFKQFNLFAEPKLKKRKRDETMNIAITSDGEYNGNGLAFAVRLWDLLHASEYLQREMLKLSTQFRLDPWLNLFLTDLAIYKGLHHECLTRLPLEPNNLCSHLRFASSCFFLKDYKVCFFFF